MINKSSSVPMYEQVAHILAEEIAANKYERSCSIGTHAQLAVRFGVSIITIRKAISLLVQQGLVDVTQGKGTFVKSTRMSDNLTRLTGVDNIISDSNMTGETRVITFEMIDTPETFDTELKHSLGRRSLRLERLHIVESTPAAYAEIWLPMKYGEMITKLEVETNTIYQLYETKWHMSLGKGRQIIRADAASEKVAEALGVPQGSPVLSITRRAYTDSGQLVEYMQLYYEYTQYSFSVELQLSSI